MKTLLVIPLLLALGGCASFQNAISIINGTTVSPTTVYVAANALDTLEQTATNYLNLPLCTPAVPHVCRTQAISIQIVSYIRKARPIRNQLEALISQGSGNAPIPVSLYASLTAIISSIQQTLATSGS